MACSWEYIVHQAECADSSALLYYVDAPEHTLELRRELEGRPFTTVQLLVPDWDETLTPWPAPKVFAQAERDFGGGARATLGKLLDAMPEIERELGIQPRTRLIGGYSLAGLFSLWTFTQADEFAGCACLSGSLWYDGWLTYLEESEFPADGRFAYLSIGKQERFTSNEAMRSGEDCMANSADLLSLRGVRTTFEVLPGSHFKKVNARLNTAFDELSSFVKASCQ
ncbi:alpha/beta hydrolase [Slackia heliotrinireducens]|uniref:alpha/beta hydrolase n=1 Tax=Slackia heliotrinireducens TaxID=84110 RepID=UPI0033147AA1